MLNVSKRKLPVGGLKAPILTRCDHPSCTQSGSYKCWMLDHEWQAWYYCKEHMEEAKKIMVAAA
jgi:hypothetical protein